MVEFWTGGEFKKPHENIAAARLRRALRHEYDRTDEFVLAVFNVYGGAEFDLLMLKTDALVIVDFKECDKPLLATENGPWQIRGGGQLPGDNPFRQISGYRYSLMKFLNNHKFDFLRPQKANLVDFVHINGVIAVSPTLHPDSTSHIDQRRKWFHLVGIDHLPQLFRHLTSEKLTFSNDELRILVKDVLDCKETIEVENDLSSYQVTGDSATPHKLSGGLKPGKSYYILSRGTNLAVDVPGARLDDIPTQLWTAPGWVNNQLWQVVPTDSGYCMLIAKHSRKCLDVEAAGRSNGNALIQYKPEHSPHQQWKIDETRDGCFTLAARHSDQYLDRDHLGFANGSKLQIWDRNGWPNQDWDFVLESDLLIGRHFLIDGPHIVSPGSSPEMADLSHLLALVIELARRRATYYCWFEAGQTNSITKHLCTKFPLSFGEVPLGIEPNAALVFAAVCSPSATIITSGEGSVTIERASPVGSKRVTIAQTSGNQLGVPSFNILVDGGDTDELLSILYTRLVSAWQTWAEAQAVWTKVGPGKPLPIGALIGGHEADGTPLYVARAYHNGGLHPGKVVNGVCHIGYGERAIEIAEFEVPIVQNGSWAKPLRGCAASLIGGYENGNPLIVCRAKHESGLHPGKVIGDRCNFAFGSRELSSEPWDFEVYQIPSD